MQFQAVEGASRSELQEHMLTILTHLPKQETKREIDKSVRASVLVWGAIVVPTSAAFIYGGAQVLGLLMR